MCLCFGTVWSQDSTASSQYVNVPVETLRHLVILEDLYIERGIIIDSLMAVNVNCDSTYSLIIKSMAREREYFEACEKMKKTLIIVNLEMSKDLRRSRILSGICGGVAVLAVGFTVGAIR